MQEAIWEDLPQVLWRTGYSSLGLMKLLLITGPPVLNLCVVSLVGDEYPLCVRPDWHCLLLSLSLSVGRLDKVILCVWCAQIFDFMHVCHRHASKYVSTLFSVKVLLCYKETTEAPRRIIKHQSKNRSIQRVVSPTPFPRVHLSFTYKPQLSPSLPTGVRLLCKAAWMGTEITEGCLCSWFPFHFEVSPAHRNRGHKARLVWRL